MLVSVPPLAPRPVVNQDYPFGGTALTVVFAATERTDGVCAGQRVLLADASVISADDAYLVLPLRARMELVRACAMGHIGRLTQWLGESVVVRADADLGPSARLWVGEAWRVDELLERPSQTITESGSRRLLEALNNLPPARTLCPEGLFDAEALLAMQTSDAWFGPTRQCNPDDNSDLGALSAWVWSMRRVPFGVAPRSAQWVDLRLVLVAHDDDSFTAMIAPATLCPTGGVLSGLRVTP